MSPHRRGHREVRHCTCGGSLDVRSTPPGAALHIAGIWDGIHSGNGHAPTDARHAAAARRRLDS